MNGKELDRTFWSIILTSFSLEEIEALAIDAAVHEKSTSWSGPS